MASCANGVIIPAVFRHSSKSMKFVLDSPGSEHVFSDYGSGFVSINNNRYEDSLIIFPDHIEQHWPVQSIDDLSLAMLELFSRRRPDIALLGTGASQQFPGVDLLREFAREKLTFDVMDTAAACRTYNLLISEGRDVGAAIMVTR